VEIHLMSWFCLTEYMKNTRTYTQHYLASVVTYKEYCENSFVFSDYVFRNLRTKRVKDIIHWIY